MVDFEIATRKTSSLWMYFNFIYLYIIIYIYTYIFIRWKDAVMLNLFILYIDNKKKKKWKTRKSKNTSQSCCMNDTASRRHHRHLHNFQWLSIFIAHVIIKCSRDNSLARLAVSLTEYSHSHLAVGGGSNLEHSLVAYLRSSASLTLHT